MKTKKLYIPILLFHIIGVNFFFLLWYLLTDGTALKWYFFGLDFYSVLIIVHLTVFAHYFLHTTIRKWIFQSLGYSIENLGISLLVHGLAFPVFVTVFSLFFVDGSIVRSFITSTFFISMVLFHWVLTLLCATLFGAYQRLRGFGKLLLGIFGICGKPIKVERGFLFIDLNHSTKIANALNHKSYSALLQDCFTFLENILDKYEGIEIYQFVGDEAVLSWDFRLGKLSFQAASIVGEFRKKLNNEASYFNNKYGLAPSFKAAMHGGTVTQTFLGASSLHLAYHGEVLNTTARIIGLCRRFNTDFLMSEQLYQYQEVDHNPSNDFKKVEKVVIDGKQESMALYKAKNPFGPRWEPAG